MFSNGSKWFLTVHLVLLLLRSAHSQSGSGSNGEPPATWTCPREWYGDAFGDTYCDCGCGAYDPQCDVPGATGYGCTAPLECNQNSANGVCVFSNAWTCAPENYNSNDGCHCNCGIYDPDCDNPSAPVIGCGNNEFCGASGTCEDALTNWICDPAKYGDNTTCDCECGIYDPDCFLVGDVAPSCAPGLRCGFSPGLTQSFCGIFIDIYYPADMTSYFSSTHFDEKVVEELQKLPNLREIHITLPIGTEASQSVVGNSSNLEPQEIPAGIYNLTKLTTLALSSALIQGTLSSKIGDLKNLKLLRLGDNKLTGTIPVQIAQLSKLTGLELSGNKFTGSIPQALTNLINITQANGGSNPETAGSFGFFDNGLKLGGNQFTLTCDCELLEWYPNWAKQYIIDLSDMNQCSSENSYSGINPVLLDSLPGAPCKNVFVSVSDLGPRNVTIQWDYHSMIELQDNLVNGDLNRFLSISADNDQALYNEVTSNGEVPNPGPLDISRIAEPLSASIRTCEEALLLVDSDTYEIECGQHIFDFFDRSILGFEIIWKIENRDGNETGGRECYWASEFLTNETNGTYSSYAPFEATLTGLSPATMYEVVVTPFKIGFKFDCISKSFVYGIRSTDFYLETSEDVPESVPQNIGFSRIRSNEITLEWEPPDEEGANGKIIEYTIECTTGNCPQQLYTSGGKTFLLITGLEKGTEYGFTVQGVTSVGAGLASPELLLQTCFERAERGPENNDCIAESGNFIIKTGEAISCDSLSDKIEKSACEERGTTVETLDVLEGFWRPSVDSVEILRCPVQEYCMKGSSINPNENPDSTRRRQLDNSSLPDVSTSCSLHHEGVFCFKCQENYSMSFAFGCMECTQEVIDLQQLQMGLFVLTIMLMGMAVLVYVCVETSRRDEHSRLHKLMNGEHRGSSCLKQMKALWDAMKLKIGVKVEIGLGFLQILSAFEKILFSDNENQLGTNLLDVFTGIDLGLLASKFGIECLIDMTHYLRLVLYTIPPIVLTMLILCVYLVFSRFIYPSWKLLMKQVTVDVLFLISLLVFPGASKTIFDTFFCQDFNIEEDDPDHYIFKSSLRIDYTLNCAVEGERVGWIIYACIMILVYPVGITLVYAYLLSRYNKARDDENIKALTHALVYKYKDEYFWYEVYELCRKLFQTSFVSMMLIVSEKVTQLVALNISVIFLGVVLWTQPYKSHYDYTFAVVSLLLLVFSTQIDTYFDADDGSCSQLCRNEKGNAVNALVFTELGAFLILIAAELCKESNPDIVDDTREFFKRPSQLLNGRPSQILKRNNSKNKVSVDFEFDPREVSFEHDMRSSLEEQI